jgi:hypothetical protein
MLMSFSRIWCSISSRSDVAFFFHSLMVQRVLYRVSTQTICAAAHCRSGKQGHRYRRKTPHSEGNGTMMHTDRRAESCSGKTPGLKTTDMESLASGRAVQPSRSQSFGADGDATDQDTHRAMEAGYTAMHTSNTRQPLARSRWVTTRCAPRLTRQPRSCRYEPVWLHTTYNLGRAA